MLQSAQSLGLPVLNQVLQGNVNHRFNSLACWDLERFLSGRFTITTAVIPIFEFMLQSAQSWGLPVLSQILQGNVNHRFNSLSCWDLQRFLSGRFTITTAVKPLCTVILGRRSCSFPL